MRKLLLVPIICLAFPAAADAHRHHHKAHHTRVLEPATPAEERYLAAGDREWEEAELADPFHQIALPKTS